MIPSPWLKPGVYPFATSWTSLRISI